MLEADTFPEGWVYHYLGMGNHLAYRWEYDREYCALLGKVEHPGQEYQRWHNIAVKLCSESQR